mgnify:CR=1 FL=1
MDANMITKPKYDNNEYSWIWLDREFIQWFMGVMSDRTDAYTTPNIRGIEAKEPEQAFTNYIKDVGEYLIEIANCRDNLWSTTATQPSSALADQLCEEAISGDLYGDYEIMG